MSKTTPFSEKDLEKFKASLQEKKTRLIREIQERSNEARMASEESGDLADQAFELTEREFNLNLGEKEREILADIDAALKRIDAGTYGICVDTGEPILRARLEAVPEAKRSLAAQEKFDKEQARARRRGVPASFLDAN